MIASFFIVLGKGALEVDYAVNVIAWEVFF